MATTAARSKSTKTRKTATTPKTATAPKTAKTATPERRALDTGGRPAQLGKGGVATTTGYQRGCRCDLCRAAATDAKRRARDRKRQAAEAEATAKAEKTAKGKARRAAKAS